MPGQVIIGWAPDDGEIPAGQRVAQLSRQRTDPDRQRAADAVAVRTGLPVLEVWPEYGNALLAVPEGQEAAEMARLEALPWVRYAELNYLARAAGGAAPGSAGGQAPHQGQSDPQGVTLIPNDPYFGSQWNLSNVRAAAAWDLTLGSLSFVVAVLDSGIDASHPEFAGRVLPGYDYVNKDNLPDDDDGHGTHVTGIVAAAINNGIGIAGLAPSVKILPLKVLDYQGVGTYSDIAEAIRRAADSNAQVINLSLGGTASASILQDAVNYARQRNALIVAAAGNCAQPSPECGPQANPTFYPAAYDGVVAVGASTRADGWASYSGYKPYLAIVAPGGTGTDQVWSTVPVGRGSYNFLYGTSVAAPHAAAAAALAWTMRPTATNSQIAEMLTASADKVGPYPYAGGRNDYFGYGRLNVEQAVRRAIPPTLEATPTSLSFSLDRPCSWQSSVVTLTNSSGEPLAWQAAVLAGADWLSLSHTSGTVAYGVPATLTVRAGPTMRAPGTYDGFIQIRAPAAQPPLSRNIPVLLTLTNSGRCRYLYLPHFSSGEPPR